MRAGLLLAARTIEPALSRDALGSSGRTEDDLPERCTTTVSRAISVRSGPRAAVYVAWDAHGRCLYVGSVRRPKARAAVRDRIREHLRDTERLASWYAISILPIDVALSVDVVRLCEGWVASQLRPRDGTSHPAAPATLTVSEALAG